MCQRMLFQTYSPRGYSFLAHDSNSDAVLDTEIWAPACGASFMTVPVGIFGFDIPGTPPCGYGNAAWCTVKTLACKHTKIDLLHTAVCVGEHIWRSTAI